MPKLVPLVLGDDKRKELHGFLCEKFRAAVLARSNQVEDKYRRWVDNYAAKPAEPVRTTPFYRASNFVPHLIRMHVDIMCARIIGIVFGTRPFWRVRLLPSESAMHELLEKMSEQMDYVSFHEMGLYAALDSTIFRVIKGGTAILKAPWVETECQYVSADDPNVGLSEETETKATVELKPIPFDDFFVYPITANDLSEVKIKFHRIRLTKEEVEYRRDIGVWDRPAANMLLGSPEQFTQGAAHESQAQEAGIALKDDVDRPFTAVEAWCEYSLTPGKLYRIVCVFNPRLAATGDGVLRSYYNYYRGGHDCFVDFRIMPREDLFYGYSFPEILEQSQEEQAQIHNSRRDANVIANVPGWKKKRYGDVPNPASEWYPSKVFELENMDDIEPLQFNTTYNSMIDEENHIVGLAERYTGVSPPMQGFGAGVLSGRRGIYNTGGTMALLAEGNRRLDVYLRRMRYPFHRLGHLIHYSYKEFATPNPAWSSFKEVNDERRLFFDIGASDASANKEIDRTSLLLMSNTMAAYYRQIVEMGGVIVQLPPNHPMLNIFLQVLDSAKDLAKRLLFSFDISDRERLVPDVRGALQGNAPAPNNGGVQRAEGALPQQDLSGFLQTLSQIQGATSARTGGGNGPY